MAAEAKEPVDPTNLFYNVNYLGKGVNWDQYKKGEASEAELAEARAKIKPKLELYGGVDPLDLLVGVWTGLSTMGPMQQEDTTIPGEENGVPQIEFQDFFEFNRISTSPSTVAYRQNAFAQPGQHLAGQLIHSECGYFRWFPTAPSSARLYEFEQCRAVGRGITSISQGNNDGDDPSATLKFTMESSTQSGNVSNTFASTQGGIKKDGDAMERNPRGFGLALNTNNKWELKNGQLTYHLTIGIQNPTVVESPDKEGKGPGFVGSRFIINHGMTKTDQKFPYPTQNPQPAWTPSEAPWKQDPDTQRYIDDARRVGPPPFY